MSKLRPDPAPTTWISAAHSALESMSPTEAFWTFRIFPRMGSSAWKSEERASLAVPSAESPSTMNSSERATSSVRQSASLVGIEDVSSAFFRRCVSLWTRAEMRDFISLTIFSSSSADWALSLRLAEFELGVDLLFHHLAPRWPGPPTCPGSPWSGPRTAAPRAGQSARLSARRKCRPSRSCRCRP